MKRLWILLLAACNPAPGVHDAERVCPRDVDNLDRLDEDVLINAHLFVLDEEAWCWAEKTVQRPAKYWCVAEGQVNTECTHAYINFPTGDGQCGMLPGGCRGSNNPGMEGTDPYLQACDARPECCGDAVISAPFCEPY